MVNVAVRIASLSLASDIGSKPVESRCSAILKGDFDQPLLVRNHLRFTKPSAGEFNRVGIIHTSRPKVFYTLDDFVVFSPERTSNVSLLSPAATTSSSFSCADFVVGQESYRVAPYVLTVKFIRFAVDCTISCNEACHSSCNTGRKKSTCRQEAHCG
jgi:hypothetical protein